MKSQGLDCKPEARGQPQGRRRPRRQFINRFKEVQRLKTQLDQYTDLPTRTGQPSSRSCPRTSCAASAASIWKPPSASKSSRTRAATRPIRKCEQLDFEFVLFASAVIDYDYIMDLIARYSSQTPGKQKMSREQLIGLIQSDAKFMDERDDIAEYIGTLKAGEGLDETAIRDGYERFKAEKTPPDSPPSPRSTAWPPPPCKPLWTASCAA